MTARYDLILRRVRLGGETLVDVAIRDGVIAGIGPALVARGPEFDGAGAVLIPGLIDHHIHLFATTARMASVDLSDARDVDEVVTRLRNHTPVNGWVRAIGYEESVARLPDAALLDSWIAAHPIRVQDRTGALWVLNSAALRQLGPPPYPPCVELDEAGLPNGRIWRGDNWLREMLGGDAPDLAPLSAQLSANGITGVTDAGASNGPEEAALFAAARDKGQLAQRLCLMGRIDLPASPHYQLGPVKLLYDESALPDVAVAVDLIRGARAQGRAVAAHCVALAELLFFLAALEAAGGTCGGDRIEHGGIIPASLIADIARAGLIVVSQPDFIRTRGERYLREVPPDDWPNLYRLRSLHMAGVGLAAGSDAPYGDISPWAGVGSALSRHTNASATIGHDEALDMTAALALYGGSFEHPGNAQRPLQTGDEADLCLLAPDWEEYARAGQNSVRATLIAGNIVFQA